MALNRQINCHFRVGGPCQGGGTLSGCHLLQPCHPVDQALLMLFLSRIGVFHLPEHLAGEFGTIAAIFVPTLVHRTAVKRANFCWHMFKGPEGLPFHGMTAVALVSVKFTF